MFLFCKDRIKSAHYFILKVYLQSNCYFFIHVKKNKYHMTNFQEALVMGLEIEVGILVNLYWLNGSKEKRRHA